VRRRKPVQWQNFFSSSLSTTARRIVQKPVPKCRAKNIRGRLTCAGHKLSGSCVFHFSFQISYLVLLAFEK
jgi:hypothetical protein